MLICIAKIGRTCRSVPFNIGPWPRVGDHFGDQNVRSTFAGFSLRGEAPNAGERGGPLPAGLPDVAQQQKQKPNEDYDISEVAIPSSLYFEISWVLRFTRHRADIATKATWPAFETRGSRRPMRSIMPQARARSHCAQSRLAEPSRSPVTTAARQENSSKSFRILMAIERDPRSASQYLYQKVMDDRMN